MDDHRPEVEYRLTGFPSLASLLAHYRDDRGYIRVDLGCGFYKPAGFVGIDNLEGAPTQVANQANLPDILMDLRQPTPLADGSCSVVRASHFLEHSCLDDIFREVYRLLTSDGTFVFVVPYANSAEGMYPGHLIFLTEKWFRENILFQSLFTIEKVSFNQTETYSSLPWVVRKLIPFDKARQLFFNACNEMTMHVRPKPLAN